MGRSSQEAASEFLDALSPLLVRGFREAVYEQLQPFSPVPVTDGTFPLMTALSSGPATAAQVAARVGVDRTVITKQATVLQNAGLLTRSPDPTDARATLLTLTPLGRRATTGMRNAALNLISTVTDCGINETTLSAATNTLKALRTVALPADRQDGTDQSWTRHAAPGAR